MPIELSEESGGRILRIQVSGKLVKGDYAHFLAEFERLLRERGKPPVLFDMSELEGWDAAGAWEDFKFDVRHFSDIDIRLSERSKEFQV